MIYVHWSNVNVIRGLLYHFLAPYSDARGLQSFEFSLHILSRRRAQDTLKVNTLYLPYRIEKPIQNMQIYFKTIRSGSKTGP